LDEIPKMSLVDSYKLSDDTVQRIIEVTRAVRVESIDEIQPLWNNYGALLRLHLHGSPNHTSVILKHIQIPKTLNHPRGFENSFSNQRKIRSYQIERHWYNEYNKGIEKSDCPTPTYLDSWEEKSDTYLLLEDLNNRGFSSRPSSIEWDVIQVVIQWLASFHARFMHSSTNGLWEYGTYWHLGTRPDELNQIKGTRLHTMASFIDERLNSTKFQSIAHGDAKLANFCFNERGSQVAAVDFQYVGGGCGMKDLAYFISSCMRESEAARYHQQILQCYFEQLRVKLAWGTTDFAELEKEWRALYPFAIADFQRFILGWSPSHYKNTSYTVHITTEIMDSILDELTQEAVRAATQAGKFIQRKWRGEFQVQYKGMSSAAADIVTEVDEEAQVIIFEELQTSMSKYNLGWLAEEGEQDQSRLTKHAFWTVDPIDGTLFFAEGLEGFAVSIALVTAVGDPIIAVVFDPATNTLYQTALDKPVLVNGSPLSPIGSTSDTPSVVLDRGFIEHPVYPKLKDMFNVKWVGGAVMNAIYLLHHPSSFYMKLPKNRLGGCAIWDLAAIRLLCENSGGSAQFYNGDTLHLNRNDRLYFNDVGFIFTGRNINVDSLMAELHALSPSDMVY